MYFSPLEQFVVDPKVLIVFNNFFFSLTNFSIFALIVIYQLYLYISILMDNRKINNIHYFILWDIISAIEELTKDTIGEKWGSKYFTLILTIYTYIYLMNIMGLIPLTRTLTSHGIVTLGLSFTLFLSLTIFGIIVHKQKFLASFIHLGSPIGPMAPIIALIEVISYFFRPISLGLRLFVNIMAGHLLLKIIVCFLMIFLNTTLFIMAIPEFILFLILVMLLFLELAIALVQTYIFTLLICMYIKDTIEIH